MRYINEDIRGHFVNEIAQEIDQKPENLLLGTVSNNIHQIPREFVVRFGDLLLWQQHPSDNLSLDHLLLLD